ncbi:hypothetical protein LR007_04505 [candidate division NPL-UPA2 bacterium]|nr:hypothetical protein [candidate division NPL-UPA2 bacterium]
MKKVVVLLIMSLFLLGVCEAGVEDIFERARERYLKFRQVATDITMEQTVTARGETIIIKRIYKKGEMFRIERDIHKGTPIINIYDGENLWIVIPERGIRRKLSQEGRKGFLLDDWFNFFDGQELKLDRIERLGRRDCYVLAGDNLFLWIDKKSLALIKIEKKEGDDEKEKFTMTFSDFKVIEGWEIPLTVKFYGGGKTGSFEFSLDVETPLPMELFCAESIEIGDPPPDLFKPPPLD